jgi:ABC-2 type transport system permease protein
LIRHLPGLFLTELRRHLRLQWSYRLNTVSWIVLWVVAFPVLMTTLDAVAGGYGVERRQASLVGFLMWNWSMALLAATAGLLSAEAREATLESILLSPVPPLILFGLRTLAAMLVLGGQTLILGAILGLLMQIPLVLSGPALLIMLLTLVGAGGFGFALAGLAFAFKSIDSVVSVFSLLALVLTGAIVPLDQLGVLYLLLKYLIPTSWGIDMLRQVTIGGASWGILWGTGALAGLALQTAIFVTVGIFVFTHLFKRARVYGELASY